MNNLYDEYVQIQYEQPKQYFIVYNNMRYLINYDLFKFSSKYLEISQNSDIDLNKYDPDHNISKLPNNDVVTFIQYIQGNRIQITNTNICTLHYLSHKYKINQLIEITENYIEKHQNEVCLNILLFQEKIGIIDRIKYENMMANNFSTYLNNDDVFNLEFNTLNHIFEKYQQDYNNIKKAESKDENKFMMKALLKYGQVASKLFKYADISTFDDETLSKLFTEYSNIIDFQFISASILTTYLDMKMKLENDKKILANQESLKKEIETLRSKEKYYQHEIKKLKMINQLNKLCNASLQDENGKKFLMSSSSDLNGKKNYDKLSNFMTFFTDQDNNNFCIVPEYYDENNCLIDNFEPQENKFIKSSNHILSLIKEPKEFIYIFNDMTEIMYKNEKLKSIEFKNQLEQFPCIYFDIKYPSENFENIYNDLIFLKQNVQTKLNICISYHDLQPSQRFHGNGDINLVHFDSAITYIDSTFEQCSSLMYISIPSSVISIGNNAFKECSSLKNIEIPLTVQSIGNNAFEECRSLSTIIMPKYISLIGNCVFKGCSSLTSIKIPTSVTSIGNNAFEDCSSLTNIEIPSSVSCIKNYAFSKCSSLKSINIPSSVSSIGNGAFFSCSLLTNVQLNSFYILFGDSVFCECCSLNCINIKLCLSLINDGFFYNCSSLTYIEIPSSVTSIGNYAFNGCSSLKFIKIPIYVTSIGNYSFRGCTALDSIQIPVSVTAIGESAFVECSSLKSVIIPSALKIIRCNTFCGCSSIKHVEIPSSVKKIGKNAFLRCSSLENITVPSSLNINNIGISSKVKVKKISFSSLY